MAIVFSKALSETELLNSHNSNTVEFYSDNVLTAVKCTLDYGDASFEITPSPSGNFDYDLINATKGLLNTNNFEDTILPDLSVTYDYIDNTIYKLISLVYTITFDNDTTETTTKNYKFVKAVKQPDRFIEKVFDTKSGRITALLPFADNSVVSFVATYFVGFPFDIPVYIYTQGTARLTNKTTGFYVDMWLVVGVNRIYFSDGDQNVTIEDDMPMVLGINEIEIMAADGYKITVFVNKKIVECGPYLKYYSSYGGYGYFLFNEIYQESKSTKIIDVLQNAFTSIEQSMGSTGITGKQSETIISLFAEYLTEDEFKYLAPLLDSPRVELYLYPQYVSQKSDSYRVVTLLDASYFTNKTKKALKDIKLNIAYTNNTLKL